MPRAVVTVGADTRPALKQVAALSARVNKGAVFNVHGGRALGQISANLGEFQKSLEASNARVLAFGASTGILFAFSKALKAVVSDTIQVEKQLADINVILQASKANFDGFTRSLFDVARSTAQSFDVASEAAGEFARQGLSLQQTLKATEAALILTRLTGLDVAKSVEGLTAIVNTFNKSGKDYTEIVSQMASVDAAFAVSSADLVEGIKRVGSSAVDGKISLEELNAAIASTKQISGRDGAVIGNAFKTIFARIQTSDVQGALKGIGIDAKQNGEFRNILDVIEELGDKLKDLSAQEGADVVEKVAGKRQINTFRALLSAFEGTTREASLFGKALDAAENSAGAASIRNRELNDTLDALLKKTSSTITEFNSLAGAQVFEPLIRKLAETTNNIFGTLKDALGTQTEFRTVGEKIGVGLLDGISGVIGGPGLALLFATLGKLLLITVRDLGTGAISLFDKSLKTQKALEVIVTNLSAKDRERLQAAQSLEQRQRILNDLVREELALKKQLSSALAVDARSLQPRLGRKISGKPGFAFAEGFVPAVASEASSIARGVGGAMSGAVPVITSADLGRGPQPVVVNSHEAIVDNFRGGKASAIFNRNMIKSVGGVAGLNKLGNVRGGFAAGHVPNFAGGGTPSIFETLDELDKRIAREIKSQNNQGGALSQPPGVPDVPRRPSGVHTPDIPISVLKEAGASANELARDFQKLGDLTNVTGESLKEYTVLNKQAARVAKENNQDPRQFELKARIGGEEQARRAKSVAGLSTIDLKRLEKDPIQGLSSRNEIEKRLEKDRARDAELHSKAAVETQEKRNRKVSETEKKRAAAEEQRAQREAKIAARKASLEKQQLLTGKSFARRERLAREQVRLQEEKAAARSQKAQELRLQRAERQRASSEARQAKFGQNLFDFQNQKGIKGFFQRNFAGDEAIKGIASKSGLNLRRSEENLSLRQALEEQKAKRSRARSSAAVGGSFLLPFIGEGVSELAKGSGGEDTRTSKAITGVSQGVATGLALSIFGPLGIAVGGAVGGFLSLKAILNAFEPDLEEFKKSIQETSRKRGEEIATLDQLNQAQNALDSLLSEGAPKERIAAASRERDKLLFSVSNQKDRERFLRETPVERAATTQEAQAQKTREDNLNAVALAVRENIKEGTNIFEQLNNTSGGRFITYGIPKLAAVIKSLKLDDREDILRDQGKEITEGLLGALDPEKVSRQRDVIRNTGFGPEDFIDLLNETAENPNTKEFQTLVRALEKNTNATDFNILSENIVAALREQLDLRDLLGSDAAPITSPDSQAAINARIDNLIKSISFSREVKSLGRSNESALVVEKIQSLVAVQGDKLSESAREDLNFQSKIAEIFSSSQDNLEQVNQKALQGVGALAKKIKDPEARGGVAKAIQDAVDSNDFDSAFSSIQDILEKAVGIDEETLQDLSDIESSRRQDFIRAGAQRERQIEIANIQHKTLLDQLEEQKNLKGLSDFDPGKLEDIIKGVRAGLNVSFGRENPFRKSREDQDLRNAISSGGRSKFDTVLAQQAAARVSDAATLIDSIKSKIESGLIPELTATSSDAERQLVGAERDKLRQSFQTQFSQRNAQIAAAPLADLEQELRRIFKGNDNGVIGATFQSEELKNIRTALDKAVKEGDQPALAKAVEDLRNFVGGSVRNRLAGGNSLQAAESSSAIAVVLKDLVGVTEQISKTPAAIESIVLKIFPDGNAQLTELKKHTGELQSIRGLAEAFLKDSGVDTDTEAVDKANRLDIAAESKIQKLGQDFEARRQAATAALGKARESAGSEVGIKADLETLSNLFNQLKPQDPATSKISKEIKALLESEGTTRDIRGEIKKLQPKNEESKSIQENIVKRLENKDLPPVGRRDRGQLREDLSRASERTRLDREAANEQQARAAAAKKERDRAEQDNLDSRRSRGITSAGRPQAPVRPGEDGSFAFGNPNASATPRINRRNEATNLENELKKLKAKLATVEFDKKRAVGENLPNLGVVKDLEARTQKILEEISATIEKLSKLGVDVTSTLDQNINVSLDVAEIFDTDKFKQGLTDNIKSYVRNVLNEQRANDGLPPVSSVTSLTA